jgi:hypothetical protein
MAKKMKSDNGDGVPATLAELAVYPRNPRVISAEQLDRLGKSLDKFGDLGGIVWNRRNRQLVGGHQRDRKLPPDSRIVLEHNYAPATASGTVGEGWIETPAGARFSFRAVDWDEATHAAATIAANQHGGEFDWPLLGELVGELKSLDLEAETGTAEVG